MMLKEQNCCNGYLNGMVTLLKFVYLQQINRRGKAKTTFCLTYIGHPIGKENTKLFSVLLTFFLQSSLSSFLA